MFAVLKTGGKQYKVASGDTLRVEKLAAVPGETVQFNEILMVGDQVGAPFVAGAAVQATVIDQVKGEKVIHFVRRRRKHSSKRTKGHRQQLTLVRVTDILPSGSEATGVKAAAGAGFREPSAQRAPAGPLGAARRVASQAAATVAEQAEQTASAIVGRAEQTASAVAGQAESVIEGVEATAEKARDVVVDAVEDVTESKAGKVALAAAAAVGVAAIAAAVLLPSTPAQADDADSEAGEAPEAENQE